jgi:hypothetical protein
MSSKSAASPDGSAPSSPHKTRRLFTSEEDTKLLSLVEAHGCDSWRVVAHHLPGLTPRQCKERYFTYLGPNVRRTPWTDSEDALLLRKVQEHGQRWADISKFFEGRTPTALKNRWHLHMRASQVHSRRLVAPPPMAYRVPWPLTVAEPERPRQHLPSVFNFPFPAVPSTTK